MKADADWMALALEEAALAAQEGEVPVGAVVVHQGQLLARARNATVARADPTAHAEMLALRQAAQVLGNYRLNECELFVTLEPCTMCSGAVLNARLSRLVYGASEPKTGAAGSVLNVFEPPLLNAHTTLSRGLRAAECGALLQDFFARRRREAKATQQTQALRDDALRTPEAAFAALPDGPWAGSYIYTLPALKGLRMHLVDEGPKQADLTWLCLHDVSTWGYAFRDLLPVWRAAGHRVVVPDLIGFGRSDKPKREDAHGFEGHCQVLLELLTHLDVQQVVLVGQGWGGVLGLGVVPAAPTRFRGLLALNSWMPEADPGMPKPPEFRPLPHARPTAGRRTGPGRAGGASSECAAWQAPYPDAGHAAALRAGARLLPDLQAPETARQWQQARHFWRQDWQGLSRVLSDAPLVAPGQRQAEHLAAQIRRCPEVQAWAGEAPLAPQPGAQLAAMALQVFA